MQKGYDTETQRNAVNTIEENDYDLEVLSTYEITREIRPLTEEEKEYVKYIIKLFDNNWVNGNYLHNKFPKVKRSDMYYKTEQITFVNKYLTVIQSYYDEMEYSAKNFKENFEKIQKLIIFYSMRKPGKRCALLI